jgi:hypothetical protein
MLVQKPNQRRGNHAFQFLDEILVGINVTFAQNVGHIYTLTTNLGHSGYIRIPPALIQIFPSRQNMFICV